ncbi:DUF2478 domain-containing protein [Roseovarius pacificus]|uniref:DUF2478 domain-containing protein n=1 Tax=Roseovarius pacificus TaxID=337701 RepID=UPI00403972BA
MSLAYVMTDKPGATDRLLCDFAALCAARGRQAAGVVQTNTDCADSRLCDMDVRVLPNGEVFRISQSLGANARGCRLDPAALELAVAAVEAGLSHRPDLLIVNKFGKHEANGRGFRDLIAHCLADGIPVLLGVNRGNHASFLKFSDGLATQLDASKQALDNWAQEVLPQGPHAA